MPNISSEGAERYKKVFGKYPPGYTSPADQMKAKEDSLKIAYNIQRYQQELNPNQTPDIQPGTSEAYKDSADTFHNFNRNTYEKARAKQLLNVPLVKTDSLALDLKPPKQPSAGEKDQAFAKVLEQRVKAKQLSGEDATDDLGRLKNISEKSYRRMAKSEAENLINKMLQNPELGDTSSKEVQKFIEQKIRDHVNKKYGLQLEDL